MLCINKVFIGGFVENVIRAKTKYGYPAACLRVKMKVNDVVTYTNVNLYDENAELCEKIKKGDYVVVVGRLTNRKIGERYFTEVKGEELTLFIKFGERGKEVEERKVKNEGDSASKNIN